MLAPVRDRMPTLPFDLSEYAAENTGPDSWSAHPNAEALSAWVLEAHDDPTLSITTELLVGAGPDDVPRLAVAPNEAAAVVTHREAFVLASIDGTSTLETMVTASDLPPGELLETICRLCARGIVTLDRAA